MISKNKILLIFLSLVLTLLVTTFHYKEKNQKDHVPKSAYFVKKVSISRVSNG